MTHLPSIGRYRIEIDGVSINTDDISKIKKSIKECFKSKNEIDVFDTWDEYLRVASVWVDCGEWNWFYEFYAEGGA
tara:strand:- start:343 stop:570 length:228 start_codon:yes stop_codon:yes gene_type:complete